MSSIYRSFVLGIAALFLIATLIASITGATPNKEYTTSDSGAQIQMSEGEQFKVNLSEGGIAGIDYTLQGYDTSCLSLVNETFWTDPIYEHSTDGMVQHIWTFKGVGDGKTTLTFKADAVDDFTLTVTVEKKADKNTPGFELFIVLFILIMLMAIGSIHQKTR